MAERLNDLLEKNYDAEKGYKNAANDVKNQRLKEFFKQNAQQRYDFGHELKAEIRNFGESPDKGSSFKADAHRAWMDLKAALTGDTEEKVLEEAIRGERAAVEDYNEAIKENNFPPSTENLLIKQRNSIERALKEVQDMEERRD
ncbi:MAG: PA2169 family four-helix-bundle protein [Salinimicrobium sp.]